MLRDGVRVKAWRAVLWVEVEPCDKCAGFLNSRWNVMVWLAGGTPKHNIWVFNTIKLHDSLTPEGVICPVRVRTTVRALQAQMGSGRAKVLKVCAPEPSITGEKVSLFFGATFKLCCHKSLALRRLITKSRNSAFTEGFWNCFLKETSQVDGRTKNKIMKSHYMEHCGSGTPQPPNKLKMAADGWNYRWSTCLLMWPKIVLS